MAVPLTESTASLAPDALGQGALGPLLSRALAALPGVTACRVYLGVGGVLGPAAALGTHLHGADVPEAWPSGAATGGPLLRPGWPASVGGAGATLYVPVHGEGAALLGAAHLEGEEGALAALQGTVAPWAAALCALWLRVQDREGALRADAREFSLLRRAVQVLDPTRGAGDLFQQMVLAVHDLLEVEHVGIGMIEGEFLMLRQSAGAAGWLRAFPLGQGVAGRVARSGEAALVPDVSQDPEYVHTQGGVQSQICVPLLDGARVVGVLNVESERRLGHAELRPLLGLSAWLGRALERERLHADTDRQRTALDLLHGLRTVFDTVRDEREAVGAVLRGLHQSFGYSHVSVYLRRGETLALVEQLGYADPIEALPLGEGVMGRALRSGQAQWVPDLGGEPGALLAQPELASEVCVPLAYGGETRGVLNVETAQDAARLGPWDVELLGAVGGYLQQTLERLHLQAQAREQEATYRLLAEHTGDLVCLHAPGGALLYVSPSARSLLGREPGKLLGRHPREGVHPDDWGRLFGGRALDAHPVRFRARHADGRGLWLETTLTRAGEGGQFVSSTRDVTARHEAETALAWAAQHDPLTGLSNRNHLYARLEQEQARARTLGRPDYAVLYLDMDRFKVINDSLGHAAGDELLCAFARRLQGCVRRKDLVARLGGDEFAVLMTGVPLPDLRAVQLVAASLERALEEPFLVQGHPVRVAVSMGIAPGRPEHAGPEDVLRDADLSMYRAKRDPAVRVATYDPRMHDQAVRLLRLSADLPGAASRGEISVVYQPVVDLDSGQVEGVEALARWTHPELGPVPPDEFIPLAEELEHIAALGAAVLEQACAAMQSVPGSAARLQVNVSPRQLLRRGFVQTVADVVARTGFPAGRLGLEVTEGALISDIAQASQVLSELRALGIAIHIDDFGTGYSSLASLHRLPLDALKIDRAFVSGLGQDPLSQNLVQTVLLLGQALGVRVIAEGIETPEQRERLRQLGCRWGQGYLLGRPLPKHEALALLGPGAQQALPHPLG